MLVDNLVAIRYPLIKAPAWFCWWFRGQGHNRMVLTLSREGKTPVPEILEFVRQARFS